MTATAGTAGTASSGGGRFGRLGPWPFIIAGVLLVAWVGGRGHGQGEPLDPRSTEQAGTKALVTLLREEGAKVDITSAVPTAATHSALILRDQLTKRQRSGIRRWVRSGGLLVVTDPISPFVPPLERRIEGLLSSSRTNLTLESHCSLRIFEGVGALDSDQAVPFRPGAGATGCFPRGRGFVVVATPEGAGSIIAIGGAGPFVNANLASKDNSVLAVRVLGPNAGATIAVLQPEGVGGGDKRLLDLVSRRVKDAMWQLLIAFLVVAAWRSRRLGGPVLEPQLVDVPGSELVSAVGNLLHQARRRDQAASMLRRHLRRTLSERLGLAANTPIDGVAAAVRDRTGIPPERVVAALSPAPLSSDADLVALGRAIEHIRKEILHV